MKGEEYRDLRMLFIDHFAQFILHFALNPQFLPLRDHARYNAIADNPARPEPPLDRVCPADKTCLPCPPHDEIELVLCGLSKRRSVR